MGFVGAQLAITSILKFFLDWILLITAVYPRNWLDPNCLCYKYSVRAMNLLDYVCGFKNFWNSSFMFIISHHDMKIIVSVFSSVSMWDPIIWRTNYLMIWGYLFYTIITGLDIHMSIICTAFWSHFYGWYFELFRYEFFYNSLCLSVFNSVCKKGWVF